MTEEEIKQITKLHKSYIPTGFLSTLPDRFLFELYSYIEKSPYGLLYIEKKENRVIGFVSGTTDIKKLYLGFIFKKGLKVACLLLPYLLNRETLFKLFETVSYPVRSKSKAVKGSLPKAELLSIVVHRDAQRKGYGQSLFYRLKGGFKEKGIRNFKVVVGANNFSARRFYEKMGGELLQEIEVHRGVRSVIYRFNT